MQMNGERELELLKKIGFTRVAGSEEEYRAAEILKAECEAIGVPAVIEPFEIEDAVIKTAKLEILEPFCQEYAVTGYKCAENTPAEGLAAEFLYVENATEVDLREARGKIVLVNGFLRVPLFQKLMKAGVAGIITMEGELRDRPEETDLSTRKLRRTLRAFGNVPMVHVRVKDAMDFVARGAAKARIVLDNETVERTSHNVIATVLGTEKPEEVVSFGAHYDSVDYSTGVYDNGAGSVINMEILRYFRENPPRRTVKFMWYGSEEIGQLGLCEIPPGAAEGSSADDQCGCGRPRAGRGQNRRDRRGQARFLPGIFHQNPRVFRRGAAGNLFQRFHSLCGQRCACRQLQQGRSAGSGLHPQPV